jgi:hypothetical protein
MKPVLDTPLPPNTKVAPPLKVGDAFVFATGNLMSFMMPTGMTDVTVNYGGASILIVKEHPCGALEGVVTGVAAPGTEIKT